MSGPPADWLDRLPPLRAVIAEHGLAARRSLGQHFLLDLNLTRRIARAASGLATGTVVEVGPGPGGLTRALLAEGATNLVAIERDDRCIDALRPLEAASGGRLTLLAADALEVDAVTLGPPPVRIVANLPYNVGTPLLFGWLAQADRIAEMILMFQREVAERITARPGSKAYGRLAVAASWRAETRLLFTVPARAFTPPPKVDSAVIRLMPYQTPPFPAAWPDLEAVSAAAFGQRRKTLRRALSRLDVPAERLLEQAGIDGGRRAETLTVGEFASLARTLSVLRAGL